MNFAEKLKTERKKKGWSQEELAEYLHVSRQSVSKWENGQNYPSIEIVIKLSDLFGITIDELLRSDAELTRKVINDGKKLAYPGWKTFFDIVFLAGVTLMIAKVGIMVLNNAAGFDIRLAGGPAAWNFGSLALLIVGGIGSKALKDKYKNE